MSLKGIAQKTLGILNEGCYVAPSGKMIDLSRELEAAVDGTVLYTPEQGVALLEARLPPGLPGTPTIEVTCEATQVASHRLVQLEGCEDLVLLNYASARNAGGGFINGAKARGEDLTRCSGLYPCLMTQPDYYEANRHPSAVFYTDHVIYSPAVPWFRTRRRELLEDIFLASVITVPAPNVGQILRHDSGAWPAIEATVRHRVGLVLAVARAHGHRTLLLGAWGLGPWGHEGESETMVHGIWGYEGLGQSAVHNRPEVVADAFGAWIESPTFAGCFDRIVFGVYDRGRNRPTLRAFQERFSA